MKCPHCQEELGLNNICINVACSDFGTEINSFDNSNLSDAKNALDNKNNYSNKSNDYNSNTSPNLNTKYNNVNDYSYNINSYDNNQSINKTINKSFNIYNDNDISREEFAAFIGSHNTDHYLDYIHKLENSNSYLSWNWASFFLGPYWLLYRKLYALASIIIILTFASSHLFPPKMSMFFILIMHIVLAMFANAIYLNNSKRKIMLVKVTISNLSTTQYINRLHKKGGVNLIAPLILVAIYIFIMIISIVSFILFENMNNSIDFNTPSYYY